MVLWWISHFGKGLPSNHQVLWVDLPSDLFCPPDMAQVVPATDWRLKCTDPQVVKKNNQFLLDQLVLHTIPEIVQSLQQAATWGAHLSGTPGIQKGG